MSVECSFVSAYEMERHLETFVAEDRLVDLLSIIQNGNGTHVGLAPEMSRLWPGADGRFVQVEMKSKLFRGDTLSAARWYSVLKTICLLLKMGSR